MTPILRSITARQIVSALERDGWAWRRNAGSHRYYKKDGRLVVVPYHRPGDTFPSGTLANIIAQAGWTDDDLRRLKLLK